MFLQKNFSFVVILFLLLTLAACGDTTAVPFSATATPNPVTTTAKATSPITTTAPGKVTTAASVTTEKPVTPVSGPITSSVDNCVNFSTDMANAWGYVTANAGKIGCMEGVVTGFSNDRDGNLYTFFEPQPPPAATPSEAGLQITVPHDKLPGFDKGALTRLAGLKIRVTGLIKDTQQPPMFHLYEIIVERPEQLLDLSNQP